MLGGKLIGVILLSFILLHTRLDIEVNLQGLKCAQNLLAQLAHSLDLALLPDVLGLPIGT